MCQCGEPALGLASAAFGSLGVVARGVAALADGAQLGLGFGEPLAGPLQCGGASDAVLLDLLQRLLDVAAAGLRRCRGFSRGLAAPRRRLELVADGVEAAVEFIELRLACGQRLLGLTELVLELRIVGADRTGVGERLLAALVDVGELLARRGEALLQRCEVLLSRLLLVEPRLETGELVL